MPAKPPGSEWSTLDRDLGRISHLEAATLYVARPMVGLGVALVFVVLAAITGGLLAGTDSQTLILIAAAGFGAYMAINIGANDVANNMGPAVGARALTLGGAIAIAAICESAGALLAGGDVVWTISNNIIDSTGFADTSTFVWAMMAALISSAAWVNIATLARAPVSTTHAVVGGVMGAGIAAAGFGIVNWTIMGGIAASWVISPMLGGLIAAALLAFIKTRIIYQNDKIAAARRWLPLLIALMSAAFGAYLALKGLQKVVDVTLGNALLVGLGTGVLGFLVGRPLIWRQSAKMENRNKSLKTLFSGPLIFAAALLSFAHGANDVANAVGPVAAIVSALGQGDISAQVTLPIWVMIIGAFGISFGLSLFGPRLIRMVGRQITRLNPMRAYCVALSAAITVLLASWLGLPVSSTHIAVGAVFGVGFYREWHMQRRRARAQAHAQPYRIAKEERHRRLLVRRSHFMTVLAAWVVTVPAAAVMSASIFWVLTAVVG